MTSSTGVTQKQERFNKLDSSVRCLSEKTFCFTDVAERCKALGISGKSKIQIKNHRDPNQVTIYRCRADLAPATQKYGVCKCNWYWPCENQVLTVCRSSFRSPWYSLLVTLVTRVRTAPFSSSCDACTREGLNSNVLKCDAIVQTMQTFWALV